MDEMKLCSECGNEYPATLEYFYRNGKWLSGYCKPCMRKINSQWKKDNPQKNRDYNKKWNMANKTRARAIWRLATATYNATHGMKLKVRAAFQAAYRARDVNPDPCEVCGAQKVHGHHWSYTMEHACDVNWLCLQHHNDLHTALRRMDLEDSEMRSSQLINVMKTSRDENKTGGDDE